MGQEYLRWLEKAEKDLGAARFNFEGGQLETAAFLCQQAAEKALKAAYIKEFDELWKIHDLVELARKIDAPAAILEACDSLNPHYIETRYPVDADYTEKMVSQALKEAREVIAWSRKKLSN